MSDNPAIHRHPSGDVDIALPAPGAPREATVPTRSVAPQDGDLRDDDLRDDDGADRLVAAPAR